ncbi:MAG: hypothetical protein Q4B01_10185 [Eubacteriales bacterium]|nr:hypothetical protein [Eubacteriales bacterium]
MDSMYSILDILVCVCGLYVLYTWYMMKFQGEIKEMILIPKDVQVKKCKDKAGYIAFISNKLLIYGIAVLVCGVVGIVQDTMGLPLAVYIVVMAAFLAVTVWFSLQAKKGIADFWPKK